MTEHRQIKPNVREEFVSISECFDADYYVRSYNQQIGDLNPLEHYWLYGERAGLKPNFVFDPNWYRNEYNISIETNLLEDFILRGESLNRDPSMLFKTDWFRNKYSEDYKTSINKSLLGFYIQHRAELRLSPNAYFDLHFYYEHNPDVAAADLDGFEHFVSWGVFEGRKCSDAFDADFVWMRYLNGNKSLNPFLSFMKYGRDLNWPGKPSPGGNNIAREIRHNIASSEYFEANQVAYSGVKKAKAFAFYLPQFHAIPENDRWWGAGFTEWTNIARGVPRFAGHIQPKIPRDLGFYDLTDGRTIGRQVESARKSGLHGFCFYYYNFDSKRLLEKPLDEFLKINDSNFPFCLMWANENWTRRWDGQEQDILLAQTYNIRDEKGLIADIASYMLNDSYYKIKGRPLFFLYRADVIPDCSTTLARWRKLFLEHHGLNPIIAMAQAFGTNDPRTHGFDAAIEFPPHKFGSILPKINHEFEILDDEFIGDIRSYDRLIDESLSDFPSEFPLIKTVVPGWDNDARKQGAGLVMQGSNPSKFASWVERLTDQLEHSKIFGEKLFFVNAWNEWCEGAYLEPDTHYGFAYANSLARAISGATSIRKTKILLVGHDAYPAGAQQLLLNIGSTLRHRFGLEVAFLLMAGGALVKDYAAIGPTFVADQNKDFWPDLNSFVQSLSRDGYSSAITNSIFSGSCIDTLRQMNFTVVSLIHELPRIIKSAGGDGFISKIFDRSHTVIFPNKFVENSLIEIYNKPRGKSHIMPQGIYKNLEKKDKNIARAALGIPANAKIVVNIGYADLRKGVDIFVGIAEYMRNEGDNVSFIWVGGQDSSIKTWLNDDRRHNNVIFIGFSEEVGQFLSASDVLLLTSREDPFPSVVLEAIAVGVPVIAFEGSGGASELLRDERLGSVIPMGDFKRARSEILAEITRGVGGDEDLRRYREKTAKENFDFGAYCADLLGVSHDACKISVIVPNYNYARYLDDRMRSIFEQTYPIFEIIVLDDGSSDESVSVIEELSSRYKRDFTLIENDDNSGNVFAQWRKGLDSARGDFIWIAEADDYSDPRFIETLIQSVNTPGVLFGFCDSRAINESGEVVYDNYKGYYATLLDGALSSSEIFSSHEFLDSYLSTRNMVLNASSVLWRRSALVESLGKRSEEEIRELKLAGDWKVYIDTCLLGGNVAYEASVLNVHRRHSLSVTGAIANRQHLEEIIAVHSYFNSKISNMQILEKQKHYVEDLRIRFSEKQQSS